LLQWGNEPGFDVIEAGCKVHLAANASRHSGSDSSHLEVKRPLDAPPPAWLAPGFR
jgi:hypothetical protein